MKARMRQIAQGRLARGEAAQGVVEFALVITVLLLIFLGTIDYARFLYYDVAITSAARVGAEAASNHCPFASSNCGVSSATVPDALVLWDTYCEATPSPTLQPQYTTCSANGATSWTPTCSSICTNCAQDICVSPATRSQGTQVSVTIGYSFKAMTPLMNVFFPERSCFTGDTSAVNHHTICVASVGKVS